MQGESMLLAAAASATPALHHCLPVFYWPESTSSVHTEAKQTDSDVTADGEDF